MPLYEYGCAECKSSKELLQKFGDPAPMCVDPECPRHGYPMRKKISRTHFELKGGGWAKDGYSG